MYSTDRVLALVVLAVILVAGTRVSADPLRHGHLADVIVVVPKEGRLWAYDAEKSRLAEERIRRDERLLDYGAAGRVGFALTSRRLLAVNSRVSEWKSSRRFSGSGEVPERVLLTDRMILAAADGVLLAFSLHSTFWYEERLGLDEPVLDLQAQDRVGMAVTDQRLIGFSSLGGKGVSFPLWRGEKVQHVELNDTVAVVHTDRRVVRFNALSRWWSTF